MMSSESKTDHESKNVCRNPDERHEDNGIPGVEPEDGQIGCPYLFRMHQAVLC